MFIRYKYLGRRWRNNKASRTFSVYTHASAMSSFLGRFANPSRLKEISPKNLLLFFDPFREYLVKRGYELPASALEQIDHEALAAILANPDGDLPGDLAQRLYLVHEMATDRGDRKSTRLNSS